MAFLTVAWMVTVEEQGTAFDGPFKRTAYGFWPTYPAAPGASNHAEAAQSVATAAIRPIGLGARVRGMLRSRGVRGGVSVITGGYCPTGGAFVDPVRPPGFGQGAATVATMRLNRHACTAARLEDA